jgi:hypothetical protein
VVGVRVPVGSRVFTFAYRVESGSGAHPASYAVGIVALSQEVERQEGGGESCHSPPTNAEVKDT